MINIISTNSNKENPIHYILINTSNSSCFS